MILFFLKGPKHEIFGPGVLQYKSDLYECMGSWLRIQAKNTKFDGLGSKIAILYLLALSPTSQKNFAEKKVNIRPGY